MSCENCFNGCAQIHSDKCIRYTGVDIPELGISTNDSLLQITNTISALLKKILVGSNIVPEIDEETLCNLLLKYLPTCGDLTLDVLIQAIIKSLCSLQEQVTSLSEVVATIESAYTVDCLQNVQEDDGTHVILQAVIDKLCEVAQQADDTDENLSKLVAYPNTEMDDYIEQYLLDHPVGSTFVRDKLVPYVAYEYYGDIGGKFGANGVGIGDWSKIYICNGLNGTPDKRGRVTVGATTDGVSPAITDPITAPGGSNPDYQALPGSWTVAGANTVTLTINQIPSHTHSATVSTTDNGHTHFLFNDFTPTGEGAASVSAINYSTAVLELASNVSYRIKGSADLPVYGKSSSSPSGISVSVSNANAGSSGSHSNIQPTIACIYIMYIP